MLLAVVGLAFYGYYTVFNAGNLQNTNNEATNEAMPGVAAGDNANNSVVPLGDNTVVNGENLNR